MDASPPSNDISIFDGTVVLQRGRAVAGNLVFLVEAAPAKEDDGAGNGRLRATALLHGDLAKVRKRR
jgi:hypothetical protein